MRATGYIMLTFRVHKEGAQYVAHCEELGVSTCAGSIDQAFERLGDAVTLYLDVLEEEHERERVFAECALEIRWDQSVPEAQPVRVRPDVDIVKLHRTPVSA